MAAAGEPMWPQDLPLPARDRTGLRGAPRWLWMKKEHAAGQPQPGLFQRPRAAGDPDRVGICCSGGGLRSAAFSFGAMDTLWNNGVLPSADFLAGVSGGSYAVTAATIVRTTSQDWPADAPGPYSLGSPELDYLRNRTNYLAPGVTGRWNMFLRLLLGIALNLAFVIGGLFVIGRVLGLFYRAAVPALGRCIDKSCSGSVGLRSWTVVVVIALAGIGLAAGLVDLVFRPSVEWWWRRLVRWSGAFVFAAIVAAVVLLAVPLAVWTARTGRFGFLHTQGISTRGVGSVATAIGSLTLTLGHLLTRSGSSGGKGSLSAKVAKVPPGARKVVQRLAVGVVVPLSLLAFLLVAIDQGTRPWGRNSLVAVGGAFVAVALMSILGNPIAWSAQPFYKRRLRTVFSLTRTTNADGVTVVSPLSTDQEVRLSDLRCDGWPTLLICAAANVCDLGLTPPGMGVTGFVFSADKVGGPLVGSVPTKEYEDRISRDRWFQRWSGDDAIGRRRDVSPLSAVSISGAAVSPSMGRMNRPAFRMLITLLNLRLGVWLPNPKLVRALSDGDEFRPMVRPTYLLREMFGRNHLDTKFVYVSDGGHYENLGLVELLRRGCTTVYVVDASGDARGSMRTLGQAFALARSELGIEFQGPDPAVFANDAKVDDLTKGSAGHAIIQYAFPNGGGTGTLVYIKKAVVHDEFTPADVIAYQEARPVFPDDSTGDQFYDVEQFEAYRALGASAARRACAAFSRWKDEQAATASAASGTITLQPPADAEPANAEPADAPSVSA